MSSTKNIQLKLCSNHTLTILITEDKSHYVTISNKFGTIVSDAKLNEHQIEALSEILKE